MTGATVMARPLDDVAAFGRMVGTVLTDYQADAFRLRKRSTVIVSPRQCGKSTAAAVVALWWAFRQRNQTVLIVSASDEAAKRLLSHIRTMAAASPMLSGSLVDESQSLLVLSNGSVIRSVPASEKAIRGWSVDLLVIDEAAMVSEDIFAAALPTTAARPDARIVVASSPWGATGWFYRMHLDGLDPANPNVETHIWRLADAPWITAPVIEAARTTLPAVRFAAEYEGRFVGSTDAFFDHDDLLAAVAPYRLLDPATARGETVCVGLDWGRRFDRHAVVAVGLLDDHGANPEPALYVPWLETSRRPYGEQVDSIAAMVTRATFRRRWPQPGGRVHRVGPDLVWHDTGATVPFRPTAPGFRVERIVSEENGVGAMPTEDLVRRIGRRVEGRHTSQKSKEDAYGRIQALLSERRLVLPDNLELLRQLRGMTVEVTASGGISINAADPNVHDDLADALSLAISATPMHAGGGIYTDPPPPNVEWLTTPGGVHVPAVPRPRTGQMADYSRRPIAG